MLRCHYFILQSYHCAKDLTLWWYLGFLFTVFPLPPRLYRFSIISFFRNYRQSLLLTNFSFSSFGASGISFYYCITSARFFLQETDLLPHRLDIVAFLSVGCFFSMLGSMLRLDSKEFPKLVSVLCLSPAQLLVCSFMFLSDLSEDSSMLDFSDGSMGMMVESASVFCALGLEGSVMMKLSWMTIGSRYQSRRMVSSSLYCSGFSVTELFLMYSLKEMPRQKIGREAEVLRGSIANA